MATNKHPKRKKAVKMWGGTHGAKVFKGLDTFEDNPKWVAERTRRARQVAKQQGAAHDRAIKRKELAKKK
jgi:hypothetical protein